MTQNEHDGNARAKFAGHRLDIFDLDPAKDFLWWHCSEFGAAKEIGAEQPKMAAHKATQFARRLFIGKRNCNVAFRELAIFSRNEPRTRAKQLPDSKQQRQWQRRGNGRPRAKEDVNDNIEHCGTGSIGLWRGSVDLPAACFNQYNVGGVVLSVTRTRGRYGGGNALGLRRYNCPGAWTWG